MVGMESELMMRKSERKRPPGRCSDDTEGNVEAIESQSVDLIQVTHNKTQPLKNA